MLDALEKVIAGGGRPVLLIVAGEGAAPPSAKTRAAVVTTRRRHFHNIAAVGVVVQGTGFGPAVHRSVISAVQFVVRVNHPEEVFATTEQAASWLVRHLPDWKPVDIVSAANANGVTGVWRPAHGQR
jgi:hypothetical protein